MAERRKGAHGGGGIPDPIHVNRDPVRLAPGAHGPADQIRRSELGRGAFARRAIFPGPAEHSGWPFRPDAGKIQRELQGRRPAVSDRRQYKRAPQTAKRRTDVGGSAGTEIIEGSI
jgi:hypothetical protein